MALVISDRIKETTNTVGTQTYQLEGAVTGFETFASNLSNGDTTYYAVTDNTNFEVGLGTINEGTSQTINYTVTVANVGGINVFVLNGVNNPVITFVKGFTYVFDVSDNTNGSHPLRFRTSADASYTDGVSVSGTQGQAGATVTIVVASDAPSTLKYYCTSHGNAMGNTINVISAVATLARTTILASSNSNNAVSFGSGTKTIFCTLPADKAVIKDASGNVGIGTSPQVPLDVNGQIRSKNGSVDLRLLPIDASNAGIIGTYSNDALVINTNSSERLRIDGSGNIGIGTVSPQTLLDIRVSGSDANNTANLSADFDTWVRIGDTHTSKTFTNGTGIKFADSGVVHWSTGILSNGKFAIAKTSSNLDQLFPSGKDDALTIDSSLNVNMFGDVTFTGTNGNIVFDKSDDALEFADNVKAKFGTGGDLEIFHDGSNSIIEDVGTGGLRLKTGNAGRIQFENAEGDTLAKFDGNGNNELYHNNVKKIETTSDGATVTGDLTTTADIELGHASDTTIARASAGVVTIEGNTVLTTGNSDAPSTTTSSSAADFVLIDDGGAMKKITPSNLGITAGAASLDDATALAIALG